MAAQEKEFLAPPCYTKTKIKQHILSKWAREWGNLTTCRQTKIFFPAPDPKKSKQIIKLNRYDLTKMVQWITGFNRLKRHNYLVTNMDNTEVKTCRLCELDDETSSHLTTDCEVLWQERIKSFQSAFLDKNRPRWTVQQLKQFISSDYIDNILKGPNNMIHP